MRHRPRAVHVLSLRNLTAMIAVFALSLLPAAALFREAAAAPPCPCSLWSNSTTPSNVDADDPMSVELGVHFTSDVDGFVTGVRFYKGPANAGPHTGSLWTASGTELATVTFTGETALGWQQMLFTSPVAVTMGTTYVVSYHAPAGHYAFDTNYFASGYDNAPLHAPSSGSSGGNGVFVYGSHAFPTDTFMATNYWVDVVFQTDLTPPQVSSTTPATGASGVPTAVAPSATFDKPIQSGSGSFTLTGPGNTPIAGTVTYTTSGITFTPTTPLAPGTTYTATVSGVLDLEGNAMTNLVEWTFATAQEPPPPTTTTATSPTTPSGGLTPRFTG